ncbi:MAG TPA: hypothetical protein PLF13_12205 [candidate division Zixibacteria bacterium]|nr:hypothetical protein [candidate division Zixibacteria bacterium]
MKRAFLLSGGLLATLPLLLLLAFGCSDRDEILYDIPADVFINPEDTVPIETEWIDSAFMVRIETVEDAYQGMVCSLAVKISPTLIDDGALGGFDLLIQYDVTGLSLNSVQPGSFLTDCDWEYFTYRQGASGNCGSAACPSGIVRVVAIADINDGENHPTCSVDDFDEEVEMARLYFYVSNNRVLECVFLPIRFIWYDCGDNGLSNTSGSELYLSRYLWDSDSTVGDFDVSILDSIQEFPTLYGANYVCDTLYQDNPNKPELIRWVDFVNGGVDVICADSIIDRADLNQDGVAWELADAVKYQDYFMQGLSVFGGYQSAATAASDANLDGETLTVADLVFLIRVMNLSQIDTTWADPETSTHSFVGDILTIDRPVGAVFMTAAGEVVPENLSDVFDLQYYYNGEDTHILLSNLDAKTDSGPLIRVPGGYDSIEVATQFGGEMVLLEQSYLPDITVSSNPSGGLTHFAFDWPYGGGWILRIFDYKGAQVAGFYGTPERDVDSLDWYFSGLAPQTYFANLYRGDRIIRTVTLFKTR